MNKFKKWWYKKDIEAFEERINKYFQSNNLSIVVVVDDVSFGVTTLTLYVKTFYDGKFYVSEVFFDGFEAERVFYNEKFESRYLDEILEKYIEVMNLEYKEFNDKTHSDVHWNTIYHFNEQTVTFELSMCLTIDGLTEYVKKLLKKYPEQKKDILNYSKMAFSYVETSIKENENKFARSKPIVCYEHMIKRRLYNNFIKNKANELGSLFDEQKSVKKKYKRKKQYKNDK